LGSAAQAPILNLSLNPNLLNTFFDHEKLEIYRESLACIAWLEPLVQRLIPITGCTKEIRIKMRIRIQRNHPKK
jgi:hypothetical protein